MASAGADDFLANTYLSPAQQGLLMNALNSNKSQRKSSQQPQPLPFGLVDDSGDWAAESSAFDNQLNSLLYNANAMTAGHTSALPGILPGGNVDFSQDVDDSFDFGNIDDSVDFDDDADDHSPVGETESHEKRKISDDDDDKGGLDPSAKRQEGIEKVPKKPGRKPLMVEPTNKRKAQNRAAQRAFRERKEKHMKDMETKVEELEKVSEATSSENGLLKAKIERLQMELREYKKRLSLSSTNFNQSNPISNRLSAQLSGSDGSAANPFQFDLPQFGNLPSNVFGNSNDANLISASPVSAMPIYSGRGTSMSTAMASNRPSERSASPQSQRQSSISSSRNGRSPSAPNLQASLSIESINNDGLAGLFASVSPPASTNPPPANLRTDSTSSNTTSSNPSRIFQFNSNAASVTSPSASSNSHYGGHSSSATSPESLRDSPAVKNKDASLEPSRGQTSLFANLNPSLSPEAISDTSPLSALGTTTFPKGIDWMAAQNGGQFDPTLFGDYRDSQLAIMGDGDFTGGFFDAALPTTDWNSPFNWNNFGSIPTGLTPALQKPDPLAQADLLSAGIEPTDSSTSPLQSNEIPCGKVWATISNNKDFQDGKLDIDDLCSELKKKARCSETGVAIVQADVDAALARMPKKNPFNTSAQR